MVVYESVLRRGRALTLAGVFVAFLASLWLIYRYGHDVPYWDEWDAFVPQICAARQGTLTLGDVFRPHAEHRIAFPRLITIANAYVTGWNRKAEMYANLILFLAATGVVYLILRRASPQARNPLWFLPVAWLMLGWHQWENFLMGAQTQFGLMSLGGLLTFYCLHRLGESRMMLPAAIAAAFVATFSFGNGLLLWPIGLVQLLLQLVYRGGGRPARRQTLIWGICSAILCTYWLFAFHSVSSPWPHGPLYALRRPWQALQFLSICTATPIAHTVAVATANGLVLLALMGLSATRLVRLRREVLPASAPLVSMILWSLSSVCLIVVGRMGLGEVQALSSRYGSITVIGIAGLYGVVVYVMQDIGRLERIMAGSLLGLIGAGVLATQLAAFEVVPAIAEDRMLGGYGVKIYQYASDDVLKRVHPAPDTVRKWAPVLRELHYSLFRHPLPQVPSLDHGRCDGCCIDPVNGKVGEVVRIDRASESGLVLVGWAVDRARGLAAKEVYLSIDDSLDIPMNFGSRREDVAKAFNNQHYLMSGFGAHIRTSLLPAGIHQLSLKIVGADGQGFCRCVCPSCVAALDIR